MADQNRDRAPSSLQEVAIADLQVDTLNPRLDEQPSQRDAIRKMVSQQGEKILNLADDIVRKGLDPSSLLICIPDPGTKGMLIAVEGNRRVVALKILENPALVEDLLDEPSDKRLRQLVGDYKADPLPKLRCIVFDEREQAHHWIELRHRGEQGGRGIVPWGAVEATRFEEREGKGSRTSAALNALNLVRNKGGLDEEERSRLDRVPLTTVQRVLNDPEVRKALGITIQNGQIRSLFQDEAEILKGLTRIIRDAARGDLPVFRVEHKEDRAEYIKSFGKSDLPSPTATKSAEPQAVEVGEFDARSKPAAASSPRSQQPTQNRDKLIPKRCVLSISDTKTNNIYRELKGLPVERFRHAVAVLFRVFLELSTDSFIRQNKLMDKQQLDVAKLKQKLTVVAKHLRDSNTMTKRELTAVYRAADENHTTPWSIETLHAYVHSASFAPTAADLKAGWDGLEPYFKTICT